VNIDKQKIKMKKKGIDEISKEHKLAIKPIFGSQVPLYWDPSVGDLFRFRVGVR